MAGEIVSFWGEWIMRRNWLVSTAATAASVALWVSVVSPLPAGEDAIRKKIQALNDITGRETITSRLQELLDHPETAKKVLAEAKGMLKGSKTAFKYNAAFLLANLAEELKDIATAEQFLRVCTSQAFELRSTGKLAQAYGNLIEMLYTNKKYEESAKVCKEVLELKVKETKPRQILIPDESEDDFFVLDRYDLTRFLRQGVLRLLVKAISKQGKHDDAMKVVENLLFEEKNDWMDVQLKAWVQREAGKEEESAKTYERSIEMIGKDKTLGSDDKEFYTLRTRYLLSGLYVDVNQIDKAAAQLKILIEKKPKEAAYCNDLGYIWADHDMNLAESEKLIRKALDLDRERRKAMPNLKPEDDRDNGSYLDSLGWVLFKQKKYKEAKEYLEKALEDKSSQHLEIYDHLGDVCLMLGQRAEALAAWRKGLEFVGDSRRDRERRTEVEKKIKKNEMDD
jgi:tetratricopeptide (TPR) repeat protein